MIHLVQRNGWNEANMRYWMQKGWTDKKVRGKSLMKNANMTKKLTDYLSDYFCSFIRQRTGIRIVLSKSKLMVYFDESFRVGMFE